MIEKTVNKVYQVVTVILIISAWGLCLFPPIFGGMVGFAILLCLTIKMFIGKFISKVKGTAGSMLPGQSSDEEPKPTGGAAGFAHERFGKRGTNVWLDHFSFFIFLSTGNDFNVNEGYLFLF